MDVRIVNGIVRESRLFGPKCSRRRFLQGIFGLVATGGLLLSRASALEPAPFNYVDRRCFVRLPDGRRLAYLDIGDANATWVIFHQHGNPSAKAEGERFRPFLQSRPGVRMITPDRPGIGDSDPEPNADYLSWPADLAALADALCIRCFALTGYSNGGTYALAAARAMPERVHVVAIMSALAPFESMEGKKNLTTREADLAENHPIFSRFLITRTAAWALRHPDRLPVSALFKSEEKKQMMRDSVPKKQGTFQQGGYEVVREAAQMGESWGWWLPEVPTKVKLLHGCKDKNAPPRMAQYLLNALPNAEIYWYPDDDHLTLIHRHPADLLAAALPPV